MQNMAEAGAGAEIWTMFESEPIINYFGFAALVWRLCYKIACVSQPNLTAHTTPPPPLGPTAVDVTPEQDGGVLKEISVQGQEGEAPLPGDKVRKNCRNQCCGFRIRV